MKIFIRTVRYVERNYPKLWAHSGKLNRRIMVRYHLPGQQLFVPLLWNA